MFSKTTHSDVVIVLPIYRNYLPDIEVFAVRHLKKYLSKYPIIIIAPTDLTLPSQVKDLPVKYFPAAYFQNIQGYNRLLLSSMFYRSFEAYQYMLIYQLDALVFNDQLLEFCDMGWDYIGAPWFKSEKTPEAGFTRSGNGGLSLRKIESFLSVLSANIVNKSLLKTFQSTIDAVDEDRLWVKQLKRINITRRVRYGIQQYIDTFKWNEDRFWVNHAKIFAPSFSIAPVEVGLQFAFEKFPRYCFEMNNSQLPFGCHAWYRYDKEFWETYLEYE